MGKLYRHGDLLLQEVESLPDHREKLPHTVLAHGEATGHAHRLNQPGGALLFRGKDSLYLHVQAEGVAVVHEEHAAIPLSPGVYRVWRQREYTPTEIRVVRD